MFRSSEAAVIPFSYPSGLTLPAAFSDPAIVTHYTTYADIFIHVVDGVGVEVDVFALSALSENVTKPTDLAPAGFVLAFAPAYLAVLVGGGAVPGLFSFLVSHSFFTTIYDFPVASCQWGGTVDLLYQGAEDAAAAKQNSGKSAKIGGNRFEVDAGTGIGTLYDDDGTTPMATRTVQNGDGSPLSEAQVLKLGMFA